MQKEFSKKSKKNWKYVDKNTAVSYELRKEACRADWLVRHVSFYLKLQACMKNLIFRL